MGIINALLILAMVTALIFKKEDIIVKNTKESGPDVQVFVDDFKALMKGVVDEKTIDNVKITMADIEGNKVGLCWPGQQPRLINLDRQAWERYPEDQREALVFHELAHCACDLDHNHFFGSYKDDATAPNATEDRLKAGFLEDGCPVSIMHPTLLSSECYRKHRDHYRYELNLRCYVEKFYKNKNN